MLLVGLTPVPTPSSSNVHIEICARFLRTYDVQGESAESRSGRLGILAVPRVAEAGREEEARALLENAVWTAPWSEPARRKLKVIVDAMGEA